MVREQDRLVQQLRAEKVRAKGGLEKGHLGGWLGEDVGCYLHPD